MVRPWGTRRENGNSFWEGLWEITTRLTGICPITLGLRVALIEACRCICHSISFSCIHVGFGYYKLRIKVKVRYQTIHEYCSNNWIHQYRTYVAEKSEFKRLKGYHGKVEEEPEDDELASITASGLCKL